MPSFHYSCFHSLIRTLSLLFLLTEIFSSITKRYVLYSFYAHVFGLSYSSLFPLRSVYLQFLLALLPFFGDFFFLFNDYYVQKYNLEYGRLVFFFLSLFIEARWKRSKLKFSLQFCMQGFEMRDCFWRRTVHKFWAHPAFLCANSYTKYLVYF